MKIIHTADWQIGETSVPQSLSRQESALLELYHVCNSEHITEVLVVGDIFQKHTPTQKEKDLLLSVLFEFERSKINLRIIPGNHDFEHSTSYLSLNTFRFLHECRFLSNVFVYHTPGIYKTTNYVLVLLQQQYQLFNNTDMQVRLPVIAAFHGRVRGAKLDNNTISDEGVSLSSLVSSVKADYFALGDIHLHQVISKTPPVVYSGAILQHTFGEKSSGFVIVDLQQPCSFEYRAVSVVPRLMTFDVSMRELDKLNEIPPGVVVKVRFFGTPEERKSIDLQSIRKKLSHCHDVVFEFCLSTKKATLRRSDKISLSSTITEDFVAYLDSFDNLKLDREKLLSLFSDILTEVVHDRV